MRSLVLPAHTFKCIAVANHAISEALLLSDFAYAGVLDKTCPETVLFCVNRLLLYHLAVHVPLKLLQEQATFVDLFLFATESESSLLIECCLAGLAHQTLELKRVSA